MKTKVDGEVIQIPEMVLGWRVLRIIPLQYLESKKAKAHRRLSVFALKGIECNVRECTCKGAFLLERAALNKKGKVIGIHIDVFTKDLELMNVDHHIPKIDGGTNNIENLYPMYEYHNRVKGRTLPENFYKIFGGFK
jgi:hypothetical protein